MGRIFRFVLVAAFAVLAVALVAGANNYNTSGRWSSTGAVTIPDGGTASQVTSLTLGTSTMTSMSLVTDGGTVTVDGSVTAVKGVNSLASGALTINTVNIATATADYTLPDNCDSATGNWVTVVVADASETVSIALADASDTIEVGGLNLDAGDELDSPSAGATSDGSSITLVCLEANIWFSTGIVGTWVDGGTS